jgi:hypothetical protein
MRARRFACGLAGEAGHAPDDLKVRVHARSASSSRRIKYGVHISLQADMSPQAKPRVPCRRAYGLATPTWLTRLHFSTTHRRAPCPERLVQPGETPAERARAPRRRAPVEHSRCSPLAGRIGHWTRDGCPALQDLASRAQVSADTSQVHGWPQPISGVLGREPRTRHVAPGQRHSRGLRKLSCVAAAQEWTRAAGNRFHLHGRPPPAFVRLLSGRC